MPGFLTHYLAGQNLLGRARDETKQILNEHEKLFNLGCQGPDIFFYYFPGLMYKQTRGFGTVMHNSNLGLFILDMANICKTNNARDVFAYTCGYIMHYALDSTSHPYVFARTTTEGASSIKNGADHRIFETAIDILMLKRLRGKNPNDFVHADLIKAPKPSLRSSADAVSSAAAKVYSRTISKGKTYSAMKFMILFTKLLQSKKGRRKKVLNFFEKITIKEPLFSSMMHDQDTNLDVLNLDKQSWQAPWEGAVPKNHSFIEMFDASVSEAVGICNVMYDFVYGESKESELHEILGNKSLKTGISIG